MNPLSFFDGYKTYAVGFGLVAYGVYQYSVGDPNAMTTILNGLGFLFGRHTLSKLEDKVTNGTLPPLRIR